MAIYKGSNFVGVNSIKEKKVYVEVPEGSTINEIDDTNSIAMTKNQYDELSDKVNLMTGKFGEKTIEQLLNQLEENRGVDINLNLDIRPNSEQWARPQGWPNLDSLNLLDDGTQDDYIYMTYDANAEISAVALHIESKSGGTPITCTIGHINNGNYIADETITGNNNNYLKWFDGNYTYNYPVVKITGSITKCYTYTVTNSNNQQLHFRQQRILERIAYIPNMTILGNGSSNAWGVFTLKRDKVSNNSGTALTRLDYAWAYCRELLELNISHLYTPNNTNLAYTFHQCTKLSGTLDLSHWNVEKVTNMSVMCSYCINLDYINLTNWNTIKLTAINSAFECCYKVKQIYGIEDIDTSGCTNFVNLFFADYYLEELNLSEWNTSKVTNLNSTFNTCINLKILNVSTWDTSKVTTLASTFSSCYSLKELDLNNWDISSVTNVSSTFNQCKSLIRLNLNNWSNNDKITTASSMFYNCNNLEELHIENLILTSKCTNIYCMFYYCFRLKRLDLNPNWDLSGIASSSNTGNNVFVYCCSLKTITGISNWKFYFSNAQGLGSMFSNCWSLENIDLSGWKVDTITSFASMFDYCYSLKQINLSSWRPTSGTNFSAMFRACYNLKSIDISTWIAPDCTSYTSMFDSCKSLTTCGDLSNLNTSKVTSLSAMFANCESLLSVTGLSNWDVSKVTSIANMFQNCFNLTSLTIANWNLALCTAMGYFMQGCRNLKIIDFSNWSVPKITNVTYAFMYTYNLETVLHSIPLTVSHEYNYCEALSHQSALTIINNLPQVAATKTLKFPAYIINQLTATEKAIGTAKGWNITT